MSDYDDVEIGQLNDEVERLRAERDAAYKIRDAGWGQTEDAIRQKAKVEAEIEQLRANTVSADWAHGEIERLQAAQDAARSAVASFPFGHLMRCAKVNGKQVCREGCPMARIDAALALCKTARDEDYDKTLTDWDSIVKALQGN